MRELWTRVRLNDDDDDLVILVLERDEKSDIYIDNVTFHLSAMNEFCWQGVPGDFMIMKYNAKSLKILLYWSLLQPLSPETALHMGLLLCASLPGEGNNWPVTVMTIQSWWHDWLWIEKPFLGEIGWQTALSIWGLSLLLDKIFPLIYPTWKLHGWSILSCLDMTITHARALSWAQVYCIDLPLVWCASSKQVHDMHRSGG